jgi:hypothetical protein
MHLAHGDPGKVSGIEQSEHRAAVSSLSSSCPQSTQKMPGPSNPIRQPAQPRGIRKSTNARLASTCSTAVI